MSFLCIVLFGNVVYSSTFTVVIVGVHTHKISSNIIVIANISYMYIDAYLHIFLVPVCAKRPAWSNYNTTRKSIMIS